MPVKKDVREVINKKTGKTVKKTTWKCEGNYVDFYGTPKRYHKRGFNTEREAKEWERAFLIDAKNITTGLTFKELYNLFLEDKSKTVKKRSYDDIKYTCDKHILPFWENTKLDKINLMLIKKWQNELLNGSYYNTRQKKEIEYSNAMLENVQMYFKSILKFGVKTDRISNLQITMFESVKHRDQHKKEMLFWELDEFKKFIEVVDDVNMLALFNVLYWCGLRLGEALALNWTDIDFNTKTITVKKTWNDHHHEISTPKTQNSYRNVIVPNKCLEALKLLYEDHKRMDSFSDNVFIFGFDKPYDDNYIRRRKNNYCKLAEVKEIRVHDLRHSHVSLLINQNINAFDIAKRLGHTVEMVNNTYGHWFSNAQQKMVDKLNNL